MIILLSQNLDTPAHIAAYNGHVDILRTLHWHDAKLNTKNKVSFMCQYNYSCYGIIMVYWYT